MRSWLLLFIALSLPLASAQCWDYDCPPEEEQTGSSAEDDYCLYFPEDCQEELDSTGGTFVFSHGWTGLWAGIGFIVLATGMVLAFVAKGSVTGRRITGIPVAIATLLAIVALVVPTIHADFVIIEGGANYFSTTISGIIESESASWYSEDAKEYWSEETIGIMRFAMPVALAGILTVVTGAALLLAGKRAAPVAVIGGILLLGAVSLFSTAMANEPNMEGTDWSSGFWLMIAAVAVIGLSPALGFIGSAPAPAAYPPARRMQPQRSATAGPRTAPMQASPVATAYDDPDLGFTPAPAPAPAATPVTVACPSCGNRVQGQRGQRVRCAGCGASGRLPA